MGWHAETGWETAASRCRRQRRPAAGRVHQGIQAGMLARSAHGMLQQASLGHCAV